MYSEYEVKVVTGYTGFFAGTTVVRLVDSSGNSTHKIALAESEGKRENTADGNYVTTYKVLSLRG